MTEIVYVHQSGLRQHVQAVESETVMHAAVSNFVDGIVGECGGDLSCATCHVFVDEGWAGKVGTPSPDEEAMLEAVAVEPTQFSRLSCQLKCSANLNGLIVHVPEAQ